MLKNTFKAEGWNNVQVQHWLCQPAELLQPERAALPRAGGGEIRSSRKEEEEMEEEVRPILVQSTKGISYFSSLHSVVYFQNANIDRVDEEGHGRKLFWKMKLKMKFYTFGILNFLKGFLSLQCT